MLPSLCFDDEYSVTISTKEKFKPPKYPPTGADVVDCYTDGSRMEEKSGAGYLIRGNDWSIETSISLVSTTTVFQAEVIGLHQCAIRNTELGITGKQITFYCDNQAVLLSLRRNKVTNALVQNCRSALKELGTKNDLKLCWIPAHSGFDGNERVDALAKEGAANTTKQPLVGVPLSKQLCKKSIDDWVHQKHKEEWKAKQGCRQSKMMCETPS